MALFDEILESVSLVVKVQTTKQSLVSAYRDLSNCISVTGLATAMRTPAKDLEVKNRETIQGAIDAIVDFATSLGALGQRDLDPWNITKTDFSEEMLLKSSDTDFVSFFMNKPTLEDFG